MFISDGSVKSRHQWSPVATRLSTPSFTLISQFSWEFLKVTGFFLESRSFVFLSSGVALSPSFKFLFPLFPT